MKRLHPSSSSSFSATPSVRLASSKEDQAWFDAQLDSFHGLGATTPIGDFLRQIVEIDSKPVALLAWGPACYALKDRDRWISWSAPQRVARLKLVVQNRRFLILSPKGASPNLASQAMGAALRALPNQWMEVFGYQPLLAESFTDPEGYAGTTYKATNWQVLGTTQGYARSRLDFYVPNECPKRLWCLELHPKARSILRSQILPEAYSKALSTVPQGLLPLSTGQFETLRKAFAAVPDPRRKAGNHQFSIGLVLSLVAMALLSGRREIAEIHRFAQSLSQVQRRRLGLPCSRTSTKIRRVPGYLVFYEILRRVDPAELNRVLNAWLTTHASQLPQALALDGKMVRDHFGILSLARHTDGAPEAMALYDQKEGTERSEQQVAAELLDSAANLDGKVITADALHCQRKLARTIIEKGGDYVLQIKGNQPHLEKLAQQKAATPGTPFLRKAK
jgi:hypothetical protein